ncbi:hypothetical protein H0E87_006388 [Populus deltoides]|uniref:Uncharacterized protein n=1 Tax=Populus deltoides TaxID=3696 RepID=A0A8T2Z6U8_POPDE|nr:hypothetical protein H0E87_006388 [Populus deltoides]
MTTRLANIFLYHNASRRRKTRHLLIRKEDVESLVQHQEEEEDEAPPPSPQELQYVRDIKRVEAPVTNPSKFLYAKAIDTGKDPKEAAKRLKIEWDSAAEIEYTGLNDETAMVNLRSPARLGLINMVWLAGPLELAIYVVPMLLQA